MVKHDYKCLIRIILIFIMLSIYDLVALVIGQSIKLSINNRIIMGLLFLVAFIYFVRKEKEFLIFEKKRYSYHRAISDLSGMDICCHNNKEIDLITCLRDWISGLSGKILPGSKAYWDLYYFDFMWFVYSKRDEWQLDEDQIYNSIPTFKKIVSSFVAELPVSKKELFSVV